MARDFKPDIGLHLIKSGNFDVMGDEWHVVSHLLRVDKTSDIIYDNVDRPALVEKLNKLGLEVLHDGRNMILPPNSMNRYFDEVMGEKKAVELSYYEKFIKNKSE